MELTPTFAHALHMQVETIYVPIKRWLAEAGDEALPIVELWDVLTASWDLSEGALRRQWLEKGECCNPACTARGGKNLKVKKCARCHKMLYCSSVCQKA